MPNPAPYWQKNGNELKIAEDLSWNFPEKKQGIVAIIGGNSNSFAAEVKIAEFLNKHFAFFESIENHFPDALKSKLPPLPTLKFYPSTEQGSFANSGELKHSLAASNLAIISGDLTKNASTSIAVANLIKQNPSIPYIITRDAVDSLMNSAASFIERDNIFFIASLIQLQKLFRTLYYPRPIMLSLPILPIVETLHKFTLSFPVSIITFHEGKIICANNGKIITTDISKTDYSPITLWTGNLAASLAGFIAFNQTKPLESMTAAVNFKPTIKQ